jgi:hypothetical protein
VVYWQLSQLALSERHIAVKMRIGEKPVAAATGAQLRKSTHTCHCTTAPRLCYVSPYTPTCVAVKVLFSVHAAEQESGSVILSRFRKRSMMNQGVMSFVNHNGASLCCVTLLPCAVHQHVQSCAFGGLHGSLGGLALQRSPYRRYLMIVSNT